MLLISTWNYSISDNSIRSEYHPCVNECLSDSQPIKAKLDLRTTAGEGGRINLCFDIERVHFFDPDTGENLL